VLSPPSKPSNFKKRVSPAKDIQHKRMKQSETNNSWKHRPDHLQVLGSSIGSPNSLGAPLHGGFVGVHDHLVSPSNTLGVMSDLGIDASLSIFGTDYLDHHAPLTTSTPNATPNRPLRRITSAAAAVAGKKTSLEWSDDEIRLFEEGLVLYGAPNWRQVAALIGSRSTSQVKQFSAKYFSTHGPNVVPHIDPARLEELRSQYQPQAASIALNKSGRLKRGGSSVVPQSPSSSSSSGDKKLVTPKKPSSMLSSSSSSIASTPAKTPGKQLLIASGLPPGTGLSVSSSSLFSPNKGPNNRSSTGRRKADEQLIVLKKTGDEDEDICIEDEEIDVDGDDEDDDNNDFLRSVVVANDDDDEEDDDDGSADEDEGEQYIGDDSTVYMEISDNVGPAKMSAPNTVAGKNHTPQWRQKPSNSFALDESGDFIREDSIGGYSDADSSVAGSENSSMTSLYDSTSSLQASAVSIAQALKALGLDGEAWIEDVEIPPPKVLELQEDHVLDLEMQANSEFFEGNAVKTPERYVRIRNHIVRTWAMNKQRYITKTSVRRGLRDCGDVNAIGRVHQFLELVGAINFGLEAPPSCRKQGQPEPLSVLMMNKAPLQLHLQQQQMARNRPSTASVGVSMMFPSAPSLTFVSSASSSSAAAAAASSVSSIASGMLNPMHPGAPSYASVAAGVSSASLLPSGLMNIGRPTIRSQFDPSFEVIKVSPTPLPALIASSNIMLVIDLHAHLHRRDGFGLIAGHFDATTNSVQLRHAIPYTGPQSAAASSLQAVSAWEKSVTAWVEHSSMSKQAAAQGTPLEILGYYTTHKLNGALSLTQFTHYKNVFCKGAARNRPFVGVFAVPFERTPDSTLFISVMYPVGLPLTPGVPQKTLCLLKRNVYCERKLPQEQFAQLYSAYAENDVALNMSERDDRDPHRTILDRCLISLSSAVFVSERDKNALWEHMRVLATEGVSPRLIAMLNTKDAVWSFKDAPPSSSPMSSDMSMMMVGMPSASHLGLGVGAGLSPPYPPESYGNTAQKLDFSSISLGHHQHVDPLAVAFNGAGVGVIGNGLLDVHHIEPRF
jgi:hypothetical protein